MNFTGIENVAIVGAGVAGLATAKTLLAQGVDCTVYERGERVGGAWADGYVNFGVQVQKELYEFPDWPLPADAPNFTPGPVFQQYLEDFCDHFGVRPHLRLGANVVSVDHRQDGAPGWAVVTETEAGPARTDHDLVVVATGLYSETPDIPELPVVSFSGARSCTCRRSRAIDASGAAGSPSSVTGRARLTWPARRRRSPRTCIWCFRSCIGRCPGSSRAFFPSH